MIVKIEHAHAAGYCSKGMRLFAKRHGLDWPKFVREGIPAEELEATGDAMATKIVRLACGR